MFKKIWYEEVIQNHILERQGKEALNSHYYATNYPDVYAAAERTFGSWGELLNHAELIIIQSVNTKLGQSRLS